MVKNYFGRVDNLGLDGHVYILRTQNGPNDHAPIKARIRPSEVDPTKPLEIGIESS
ncbi:MAG: hypothetical protein AABX33_08215 [Nanoarchaeota archaeon]